MGINTLPLPTRFTRARLGGLAACVMLGSLTQACVDTDVEIPSEELYAREFVKQFGVPDADHTWSMAVGVDARIELEQSVDAGRLEIYTHVPSMPESRLLADLRFGGKVAKGRLDVPAGTKSLYVRVLDSHDMIVYDGLLKLDKDGKKLLGGDASPAREGSSSATLPTLEDLELDVYRTDNSTLDYYYRNRDRYANFAEAITDYNSTNPEAPLTANKYVATVPGLKYLSGLYNVKTIEFLWSDLKPIFHEYVNINGVTTTGVFAEGIDHISQYYHNAGEGERLDPDVTFQVLSEGPVTMSCIWRGTQFEDYFGYYYYPADKELTPEELWNLPKFAFLTPADIRDESSLTQYAIYDPLTKWDVELEQTVVVEDRWQDWQNIGGMDSGNCAYWKDMRKIRGTRYSLVYYGENYDGAGSYTFPEGVKIGYFLAKKGNPAMMFFSDCELNYYLNNEQYRSNSSQIQMDGPLARPMAAKFSYDHRTYVGFGDLSGDCDLNDVVFIASNVYPAPEDITPPVIEKKVHSWTLACEDLGATDDFDFNDVVIDIEYAAGSGEISFIPRAAGGVLSSDVYFDGKRLDEIHLWLGAQPGVMTNVYANPDIDPSTVRRITIDGLPEDWTLSQEQGGFADLFKIFTYQEGQKKEEGKWLDSATKLPGVGSVPQMLLLREGWQWPTERTHITTAYTRFTDWTRDQAIFQWDSHRQPGRTVSHR